MRRILLSRRLQLTSQRTFKLCNRSFFRFSNGIIETDINKRSFCSERKRHKKEPDREKSFSYHSRLDQRKEYERNPEHLDSIVARHREEKPQRGTLQQMIVMSNPKHRIQWAPHLQKELLVRLSHRYNDFEDLPKDLLLQKPIQKVVKMYADYIEQLDDLVLDTTPETNREFVRLLTEFKAKDSSTLPLMAQGIMQWQKENKSSAVDSVLASKLDDLFTARLSIRMLIGQYCEYSNPNTPGRVERGLKVLDVITEAVGRVKTMCSKHYTICPEFIIEGQLSATLTCVRSHLHHIIVELLKNSARATIEHHNRIKNNPDPIPPIHIVIAGGKEDIVIKVSDEGGGIPRSHMNKIWSYQFTTSSDADRVSAADSHLTFRNNFFGSGYGLPIARVFARYFGGDLSVISTEGWGTDAYVYLGKVESSAVETLPD